MNLQQCSNGHYYDADRFVSGCPYCKTQGSASSKHDYADEAALEKTILKRKDPLEENNEEITEPLVIQSKEGEDTATSLEQPPAAPAEEAEVTMPVEKSKPKKNGTSKAPANKATSAKPKKSKKSDEEKAPKPPEQQTSADRDSSEDVPISETTLRNIRKCKNNHLYDGERFSECPYCKNGIKIIEVDGTDDSKKIVSDSISAPEAKTPPIYPQAPAAEIDFDATLPLNPPAPAAANNGATMPIYSQAPAASSDGATMPIYPQAPAASSDGATMPIYPQTPVATDEGTTIPPHLIHPYPAADTEITGGNTLFPTMSYRKFFKQYVSKKTKALIISPGIWAAVTAVLIAFLLIMEEIDLINIVDVLICTVLSVLVIWRKGIVYSSVCLGYFSILTIMTLINDGNIYWGNYLAIALGICSVIFCAKVSKAYKKYKTSGTVPTGRI